jgi:hypothetical protein
MTFSPEKDGIGILSGPHARRAVPRIVEERPMVMKTRMMIAFDLATRMGPLSIRAPMNVTVATDRKKDGSRGIPKML